MNRSDPNKVAKWKQRIADWKRSSQSGWQWCKDNNIRYSTFNYWKTKQISVEKKSPKGFVELPNEGISVEAGIEIRVGQVEIQLQRDFDEATLCRLLPILGRAS